MGPSPRNIGNQLLRALLQWSQTGMASFLKEWVVTAHGRLCSGALLGTGGVLTFYLSCTQAPNYQRKACAQHELHCLSKQSRQ